MNQRGELRKIRHNKGFFEIKLNASDNNVMVWPVAGWAPIMPLRGELFYEQLEQCYGAESARSYLDQALPTNMGNTLDMTDQQAVSEEGRLVQLAAQVAAINGNHTGHHHRNHIVRVPTAPGEPVRG